MQWTALVTGLVLVMYLALGALVGRARGRHNVPAPAMTGHPGFERIMRVHQNTAEQLIMFLPALWMFAYFVSDIWAAVLGLVFLAGRLLYAQGYFAEASRRGPGFAISSLATLTLLVGGVIGAFLPI